MKVKPGTVPEYLVRELVIRARDECEPVLRDVVDNLTGPLRHMAGYHFGWWDRDGAVSSARSGKWLRPALVFAAAAACGGAQHGTVQAAAAVELFHNFTVIHDDIMDRDHTRRGRATVWRVWGVDKAMLLGDALHALAGWKLAAGFPSAVAAEAVARLGSTAVEVCIGQYEDTAFETRSDISEAEYVRMATGKTAALLGCACALGALSAGADGVTVSAMDCFGRELGLAFQFMDDVIGIWGDPEVTGKPAGTDLARRKQTLPVVTALASNTDAAASLMKLYRSTEPMSPEDIARASALLEAAGGKREALRQARLRVSAAVRTLPDRSEADGLRALAQFAADRER
ncbi:geranylgeranyl diphosphate synthase IdsB [Nocardia sp. NPDC057030]|uniref:geranylgeranyl diphosphate synthase IdsB n=1 Tax=unclassified Nocardia TaxID=2637762 RepID=UPI00362C4A86